MDDQHLLNIPMFHSEVEHSTLMNTYGLCHGDNFADGGPNISTAASADAVLQIDSPSFSTAPLQAESRYDLQSHSSHFLDDLTTVTNQHPLCNTQLTDTGDTCVPGNSSLVPSVDYSNHCSTIPLHGSIQDSQLACITNPADRFKRMTLATCSNISETSDTSTRIDHGFTNVAYQPSAGDHIQEQNGSLNKALVYTSSTFDENITMTYNNGTYTPEASLLCDSTIPHPPVPLPFAAVPSQGTGLDGLQDYSSNFSNTFHVSSSTARTFVDQSMARQVSVDFRTSSAAFSVASQNSMSNAYTQHFSLPRPAVQLSSCMYDSPQAVGNSMLNVDYQNHRNHIGPLVMAATHTHPDIPEISSDDCQQLLESLADSGYIHSTPGQQDLQTKTPEKAQFSQPPEVSDNSLSALKANMHAPKVLVALAKDKNMLQEVLFTTLSNAIKNDNKKMVATFVRQDNLKQFVSRKKAELHGLLYDAVSTANPYIVKTLLSSKLKNLFNLKIRHRVLRKVLKIRQLEREENYSRFSLQYEETKKETDCFQIFKYLLKSGWNINYVPSSRYRRSICSIIVSMLDLEALKYLIRHGLKLSLHNMDNSFWSSTRNTLVDTFAGSIYFWEEMTVDEDCYIKTVGIELLELLSRQTKVHHNTLEHLVEECALYLDYYNIAVIPIYHGACARVRNCCNFGGTGILRRMFERSWLCIDIQFCLLLLNLGDKPPGEILLEEYQQYEQYKEACEALQAVVGTPISLQDHCRICIREYVKDNCEDFADAILALPLPGFILQYLLGKDYAPQSGAC